MKPDLLGGDLLRALIREVLTDLVRESLPAGAPAPAPPSDPAPAAAPTVVRTARGGYAPGETAPRGAQGRGSGAQVQDVVIRGDDDLHVFALRLLRLYEDPKTRDDLRAGRLRFRLAGSTAQAEGAPGGPVERIHKGAVTERHIKAAAASGSRLVLGRAAVLTPLAREKARALGVHIEKER